jgi:hypothetical protein
MQKNGRSSFQLFGKDSSGQRNRYALQLAKKAIALQLLGDLPAGEKALEEYVKQGLAEYDENERRWRK